MPKAFIGVGSNIEPEANIRAALGLLGRHVRVTQVSTFYRTEPIGRPEHPAFHNGVFEVETDQPPRELKRVLRQVESSLGRRRSADRYAPRTIDLDLLLWDDVEVESDELRLPDPEIAERVFVAVPLCELAPNLVLPGSGRRVCDIADRLTREGLEPLELYTRELREAVGHGPG
jgi:2-amino-4-hydroxy-6-hydroxymethyldihydropteridine diphosphokinase